MSKRIPPWCWALLLYLILTLLLTWPLATQWTTHLPGSPKKDGLEDAFQNVWNLWWTWQALQRPTNLLITDRFFYPETPNLFYHTLSPANTLLAAPVTALWGPIAGFNFVAFFSFVVAGLGTRALARDRTNYEAGALLAGFVYAFSPYHYAVLVADGQLQMFALQWLPWYVLFLLRAVEVGGRRNIALAGLFLTLTAWTDWYYTLFLLLFTAGYSAWQLLRQVRPFNRSLWTTCARLAAVGGLGALGAAPLLLPMLVEASRADYMRLLPPNDTERLSANLSAYFLPQRMHPWWGEAPWAWGVPFSVNRRIYLGAAALVLALLAMWREPKARPWAAGMLIFVVLSLGPNLRLMGGVTGIPLPYALLQDLPIFNLARQPDRFAVMVFLCLAVLVAFGTKCLVAWLAQRRRPPALWHPAALFLSLLALLVVDYLAVPMATRQPPIPPFLANLPPGNGALLEYPFHDDAPYRDAERMLFQTVHGRPISGGYHSRLYPQPQLGLPVLRDLRAGQLGSDIVVETGGWSGALNTIGYDYVLGYKQQPLGPQNLEPTELADFRAFVEQGLGVAGPDYEDNWLIAYRVPAAPPQPVIQIRQGWGEVEVGENARHRWLGEEAEMGLFAPQAGVYRLSFRALPAGGPRRLLLNTPQQRLELPLPPGERRYTMLLALPAGRTLLTLRSAEPPTSGQALENNGDLRPISVRFASLALERVGE